MNSSITLCPKNLISQGIQENGMRNNMTNFIDEDKINNEKNNPKGEKIWKEFKVSRKLNKNSIKDESDSSLEWDEEDNDQMLTIDNEEKSSKSDLNFLKDFSGSNFEVFTPFVPPTANEDKYKQLLYELESEGINLNNCLVIKDKLGFIKFFETLSDNILNIIKE
jgi:hypothetical protein